MEKGPPPVPDSDRPIRQIDDLPTYDDPEVFLELKYDRL